MATQILPQHIDSLITKAPDHLQAPLIRCAYDLVDLPGVVIIYPPDADTFLYVGSFTEEINSLSQTLEPSFALGVASPFATIPENCYRPLKQPR